MSNQLLIRSIDRQTASDATSDFKISLPNPLNGSYIVSNILIPNTVYMFESGINDKIYFYEDATAKTAVIPVGIYTSSNISSAIKTTLDTASGGYNTYTVSYSETTQKLTFSAGNAFYFNWSANTGDACYRQLGFNKDTDTASATSRVSPNVIDLIGTPSILMRIDQASESLESTGDNVLCTMWLPVSTSFGGYFQYIPSAFNLQKLTFNKTKHLRMKIYNSYSQEVSLNGGNYEILLTKIC